ncbi:MAG: glycosyltransferase family 39 protein [Terracidiphilus sp.]
MAATTAEQPRQPGDETEANRALTRRTIALAIGLGFAIRMVIVVLTFRDLPDADKLYERFGWEMGWIARALASGHGFSSPYFPWSGPTAMQPPLYPSLLALVFKVLGVYSLPSAFTILTINSLLSVLTCIPVYFSAKYLLGERAGRIAAVVWALYPFAIYFSAGRVWEYSLTGLLFTTSYCMAQRIHEWKNPLAWLGWGLLCGLTALSNPSTLAAFPFLLVLAVILARKSGTPWMSKFVVAIAGSIVVLTPWVIRNYKALGILCPVRDNFWLEVYDDNSGDNSLDPSFAHPSSNPAEMKKFLAMGETAFLTEKRQLAIAYIRQHPGFPIRKTLRRIVYYWTGFWSISAQEFREQPYEFGNIFQVCSMTFLMICGVRRMWRTSRQRLMPYLVLILAFPLTYYITHPLMDYRQPIEPAVIVLAVVGVLGFKRAPVENVLAVEDTLPVEIALPQVVD